MNGANFDHLEISVLLRVLRDPSVQAVAIRRYGLAELQKLIDQLAAAAVSPETSDKLI